jgi:RNA polymerase sigma-70 factor (ECF subfamily)
MNPSDFRQLFDEHTSFVWRVLRRHGVPSRDLEDGCQDVFLVVFRSYDSFEGRSAVRSWLYGIAVRVALGRRRRAHVRREQLSDPTSALPGPDAAPAPDGFDAALQSEARELLAAALEALPAAKREVFALYELEGMTMSDVAAALAEPENTVLYRLYAARRDVLAFARKREQLASAGAFRARTRGQAWLSRLKKELAR